MGVFSAPMSSHGLFIHWSPHCRGEDGELRLGIRRAVRPRTGLPDSIIAKHNSYPKVLSAVAKALSSKSMFQVCYCPRYVSAGIWPKEISWWLSCCVAELVSLFKIPSVMHLMWYGCSNCCNAGPVMPSSSYPSESILKASQIQCALGQNSEWSLKWTIRQREGLI